MHPRTRELLDHLDTNFDKLRRVLLSVPRERRELKPDADRWSVAEIVEHLAIVEARIGQLVAKQMADARAAGLGQDPETGPVVHTMDLARVLDRSRRVTSSPASRPTGTLDGDAAWAALEQAHGALRDAVRESDGLALGMIVLPHPVFGPLDLYQWIAFVGAHEARHGAQIAEAGGLTS